MRSLFLVVERERRLLVEIPGQATNDRIDVGVGVSVGLEPIPPGDEAEREGRLFIHQLEWLDRGEARDEPPSAVELNSWRCYGVGSGLNSILPCVKFSAEGETGIAKSYEHARSRSRQRRSDLSDLTGAARGKCASNRADVRPAGKGKVSNEFVVSPAEWRQGQSCRVVLEPIGLPRGVAGTVDYGRVELAEFVWKRDQRRDTGIGR